MREIISVDDKFIRQIIKEEMRALEEYKTYRIAISREINRLVLENSNSHVISEQFFAIAGAVGGGFIDTLKSDMVIWLIEKIGINPVGTTAHVIANIIEETPWLEIKSYFSSDGCAQFGDKVIRGVAESIIEPALDGIFTKVGITRDPDSKLYRTTRETLTNILNSNPRLVALREKIVSTVCEIGENPWMLVTNPFRSAVGTYQANPGGGPIGFQAAPAPINPNEQ